MHRAISWLRPVGSRGDHGVNQRFRLLTCLFLFALALLTVFSSDAVAVARQKQTQHAKKADAGRSKHHAAHKKGKHVALAAAARRKSAKSTDAPAPAATAAPLSGTAAPLSGDQAAVRQAIDLVRKGKTGEATASR